MENLIGRSVQAEKIWAGEITPTSDLADNNVALVKRLFEEVWNKGNYSLVNDLLAPDFVDHNHLPGAPDGREGFWGGVNMIRTAFPDIKFSIDQIVVEDDRLAIRLTGLGTHKGDFMGISPTGKQVSLESMTFFHIENGKIAERWGISDIPRVMQQLEAKG
ncbi:MAG: ester cyclase [Anaerolineales bacterium]